MFTPEEKMQFLNRLPPLELSYEPKLHKKVYAPLYYIVPKGQKALVWYTYWKEQNVCLLIKLNERGNYSDVQLFSTVFSDELALGTIIYGTTFHMHKQSNNKQSNNKQSNTKQSNNKQSNTYFTCEQLYYYKGLAVIKKNYQERLQLLLDMFTHQVDQVAYLTNSLIVGMPIICETYEECLAQLEQPYITYGIAAMGPVKQDVMATMPNATRPNATMPNAHSTASHATASHGTTAHATASHATTSHGKAVFKVKAGLAADNYQLYTLEDKLYDTALVPTYKCSVLLNALFRNIKENANLDLLEESDDEEEFENTQIDKFVDLEKTIIMECVYNKRFKKWQPLKTTQARISSLKELP